MIHVNRTRLPSPAVLSTAKAQLERRRAEVFFAAVEKPGAVRGPGDTAPNKPARKTKVKATRNANAKVKKKKFAFAIYRENEIKALLNQLFSGKCAYCESRYAATQPMDVEHFRPKSEVTDFDGTKCLGYYWLASEWSNLLPSCIDCNRPRIHREEPNGRQVRLGKETLFPLASGSRRASFGEKAEDVERPLLLDPCRDHPEEYLTFVEGVTVAHDGAAAPADAESRVAASVRVYGLNRTDLVQERRRVLLTLRHHFDQIRQLMLALADASAGVVGAVPPQLVLALENLLSHEIRAVLAMQGPAEPYSLMARREIEAFQAELGRGL